MLTIYIFDENNEYTGVSETTLDPEESKLQGKDIWLMPPNATTIKPTIKEGYVPVWDGSKWVNTEDHRGEEGYVDGIFTTIKEIGAYPNGWSVTPPEPTEEEKLEQKKQEIIFQLSVIDSKKVRSASAIALALANGSLPNPDDVVILTKYEQDATTLREELASL